MPDVPTFGELKMKLGDIEDAEMWYGFLAPGKTTAGYGPRPQCRAGRGAQGPGGPPPAADLDVEVATNTAGGIRRAHQGRLRALGRGHPVDRLHLERIALYARRVMKIVLLGTGGPRPDPRRNASTTLVRRERRTSCSMPGAAWSTRWCAQACRSLPSTRS